MNFAAKIAGRFKRSGDFRKNEEYRRFVSKLIKASPVQLDFSLENVSLEEVSRYTGPALLFFADRAHEFDLAKFLASPDRSSVVRAFKTCRNNNPDETHIGLVFTDCSGWVLHNRWPSSSLPGIGKFVFYQEVSPDRECALVMQKFDSLLKEISEGVYA